MKNDVKMTVIVHVHGLLQVAVKTAAGADAVEAFKAIDWNRVNCGKVKIESKTLAYISTKADGWADVYAEVRGHYSVSLPASTKEEALELLAGVEPEIGNIASTDQLENGIFYEFVRMTSGQYNKFLSAVDTVCGICRYGNDEACTVCPVRKTCSDLV